MNVLVAKSRPRPATGESPFELSEVFYSRTDGRGIIRSGNEVFRRVADYEWDRLIGAPHRIIRHPDMPKGVFHLLWDRIKAGKPTGAYIKNRARDGLHYWVFAVVTPVEDGYLSVRIKPSSQVFDRSRAVYEQLLAKEKAGMGPPEAAVELLNLLKINGFADFDEYMGVALFNELHSRNTLLNRPKAVRVAHVAEMHANLRAAVREKHTLVAAFEEIRAIPTNLHIVASRLEIYGGPVSTIAENYRIMSAEITRRLEDIAGGHGGQNALGDRMRGSVVEGLFLTGTTLVLTEVERQVVAEADGGALDQKLEIAFMGQVTQSFRRNAHLALGEVTRASLSLIHSCEELKRLMLGLDSIRVLCRVEAGRMSSGAEGLHAIIATLDRFHADVSTKLNRIQDLAHKIRASAEAAARIDR